MSFLFAFLGTILGIIVTISIIVFFIYYKLAKSIGKANLKDLINVAKNTSDIEAEEYSRPKNISGMTSLLEPVILKDFPEFNKDLLFNITEENLRKILSSIQNKNTQELEKDDSLSFIKDTITKIIEDYKQSNINVEYKDIKFHRHAIKDYRKSAGKATITISSTLEYYYKSNKKDEKQFENLKKQTRYTTRFLLCL